ncbi:contractile injection system tape measure protein [Terrabacter sp. MAHUQ-38]|uniref:contractile injection system tape measure protein n=1 Tax=unclassified Terrabacter TaxID=2630222 RepID=UPI00165E31EE|nr:contractile injection system tape measure protein [Terrabacter sp. MAHUQ-38]MBC9819855.1 hypothetical protein [Terrabacter sp. MAHUQ-38]
MTDVAVDTLRLRGPGAQRLARVAATTLPAALDRALADVADVHLEQVAVTLDLVVDDYDDETLAVLWADAIRARVVAEAGVRPSRPGASGFAGEPTAVVSATTAHAVVVAARAWSPASGAQPMHLPAALLALADPQVAAAARDQLGEADWAELVAGVARTLGPQGRPPESPRPAAPPALPADEPSGPRRRRPDHPSSAPSTPAEPEPSAHTERLRDAEAAVLAQLAGVAQVAPDSGGPVAVADLTRAAGLALLYPWLADHCRRAEALHPRLDPVDVREAALAAVVDPDDPTLADDPLVRLLAGRPLGVDAAPRVRMPLGAAREVAESAGSVLSGFAALLPGFERSSERFVRASWVLRRGLLDTERDPVLLTAATHPLDVLLPRLPYPVGLLKLPWSPPVTVRFR